MARKDPTRGGKDEQVEIVSLADLKPDGRNARKHGPRNVGMIVKSLQEVGAARSGVIDEEGNILAGSGTYEALAEAGIERVKIVAADGNEWVVVKRTGLSADQKTKLALYDNRTGELATWDMEVLSDLSKEFDLSGLFTPLELSALSGEAFLPNFHPQIGVRTYTDEEVEKIKTQLQNVGRERQLDPVKCPACGEEFYIDQ